MQATSFVRPAASGSTPRRGLCHVGELVERWLAMYGLSEEVPGRPRPAERGANRPCRGLTAPLSVPLPADPGTQQTFAWYVASK